jgi:pyruvate,water dikinase
MSDRVLIRWFSDLKIEDVPIVGGKNASLGEMFSTLNDVGIDVPDGFATTSAAYWTFVEENDLRDEMERYIDMLHSGERPLQWVGRALRRLFLGSELPDRLRDEIVSAYHELAQRYGVEEVDVAVRSSATAEDLPDASFAGQQETFLNISGEDLLLSTCRRCFASLFTDRAISYREAQGFDHMDVALSVGIQKMVRSDLAGSGVMFTLDTESWLPRCRVDQCGMGPRRKCGPGGSHARPVHCLQAFVEQSTGIEPIIEKTLGSKEKEDGLRDRRYGGCQEH